ncbi:acyl-CoA dehydrogenase family protein, partial [Rhodoferax sp.]|uniref:acyl-CoA dehydrogenase family protein n=1 Tax=Rhodoferax sp. TaxID=50421 RepID=UPI001A092B43
MHTNTLTPLHERFPYFTTEHEMLRETVRRFIETEVAPRAEQWEEQGMVPREVLRQMGELGLLGIRFESEYGGSELDTLSTVVLAEELGRSTFGGFAVTVLVHTDMAAPHLHHAGNSEQKSRLMPDIVAGRRIAAVAMTEPDAGSDLASMRTTARRDGNEWVLNGAKMFITNGVHGEIFFVAAKTGEVGRNHQISMFIVEKGTPGFNIARPLKKHGWLSSDTAELVFDNCRIPAGNLLGEEHKGFYALVKNLQNERIVLAAQAMGEASKAIELTLEWVKQRKAFGATLWDKQTIRHRLAMLSARVEAAKALIYNTAWRDAQQHKVTAQAA